MASEMEHQILCWVSSLLFSESKLVVDCSLILQNIWSQSVIFGARLCCVSLQDNCFAVDMASLVKYR